jgi:site-specific DNA-methyltransferase (adenine-specific)
VETNQIIRGDCLEVLKTLPDESIDSVVTDPPAGIEFMGAEWDSFKKAYERPPQNIAGATRETGTFEEQWRANPTIGQKANARCGACGKYKWSRQPCTCEKPKWDIDLSARDTFVAFMRAVFIECLRVLKPGGHMLVWSIPRTSHWTACAIEDAGFEIRDCIYHVFGQGFPKSLNISKAIDKMKGAERPVVGTHPNPAGTKKGSATYNMGVYGMPEEVPITASVTEEAKKWEGWGTALKPAVEPWWLCRKPIAEKNVVSQVLATGTGAINIDGTRIEGVVQASAGSLGGYGGSSSGHYERGAGQQFQARGRWPSNLVLTHLHTCKQVGTRSVPAPTINRFTDGMKPFGDGACHPYETVGGGTEEQPVYECEDGCPVKAMDAQSGDSGRASRFFKVFEPEYDVPFYYTGKASRSDKNADLFFEEFRNKHPTVKSQALMTYFVRLVTPPGGIVLDPFSGSGSTLVAAISEGCQFVGIEREEEYYKIAKVRTDKALNRAEEESRQKEAFDAIFDLPQE